MTKKLLVLFAFAAVSVSAQASAVDLGECTPGTDCDCSGYSAAGFTDCSVFTTILDNSSPAAVRSALGVSYTTAGGKLDTLELDLNSSTARILPTQDGWSTKSEINDYMNRLVWGGSGTPPSGIDPVDICDFGTLWNVYKQGGSIGRFDEGAVDWADVQVQNAFFAVLANGDGEIVVDEVVIMSIDTVSSNEDCATGSDSGFTAEQCSKIRISLESPDSICGEEIGPANNFYMGENTIEATSPYETLYEFGEDNDDLYFVTFLYQIDWVEVFGNYYDVYRTLDFNGYSSRTYRTNADFVVQSHRADGTCGYGKAYDSEMTGTINLWGATAVGTVPLFGGSANCPTDPSTPPE